jgi:Family of unknown function (DUF6116)
VSRGPVQDIVGSLVGRLRYPWVFVLLGVLFVVDLVVPDPIPFIDEVMLALLTFLVGSWRTRREAAPPEVEVSSPRKDEESPPQLR